MIHTKRRKDGDEGGKKKFQTRCSCVTSMCEMGREEGGENIWMNICFWWAKEFLALSIVESRRTCTKWCVEAKQSNKLMVDGGAVGEEIDARWLKWKLRGEHWSFRKQLDFILTDFGGLLVERFLEFLSWLEFEGFRFHDENSTTEATIFTAFRLHFTFKSFGYAGYTENHVTIDTKW